MDGATEDPRLDAMLDAALTPGRFTRLGVAVSGGGDSMALLHLMRDWAARSRVALFAATVDHGLRPASRAEAAMVAEVCEGLGIPHEVLVWQGWDGAGNLQDKARRARYRLMADWALGLQLDGVALAHTAEDQAETFLMRLARGSGIDGLSAMAPRRRASGVDWLRPLLAAGRAELRDYLTARRLGWVEDPSNADPRFRRVQARQVLEALAPLGLDADALRTTSERLGEARQALDALAEAEARRIGRVEAGDVVLQRADFLALPSELRRRLLAHALGWVASSEYAPRHETLVEGLRAVAEGRDSALHGCRVLVTEKILRISRELQAVKDATGPVADIWDRRWRIGAPEGADTGALTVCALGEAGLKACGDWRESGLPRVTLLASPAVWRGTDLVAAPLAREAAGWRAELVRGADDYYRSILSH